MTDTTTMIRSAPGQTGAGVLEHLDPTALIIDGNVRSEGLVLDADFVDSVRTQAVLVPVLDWRDTGEAAGRPGVPRQLAKSDSATSRAGRPTSRAESSDGSRIPQLQCFARTAFWPGSPTLLSATIAELRIQPVGSRCHERSVENTGISLIKSCIGWRRRLVDSRWWCEFSATPGFGGAN